MKDVQQTLISQYANGKTSNTQFVLPQQIPYPVGTVTYLPRILQFIQNFNDYIDPTVDLDAFYGRVWDIKTAKQFGLDIWGVILGVTRVLNIQTGSYFGFTGSQGVSNASGDSFGGGAGSTGQQPFYGGQPVTSNFALTDTAYRQLLLAKAVYNISDGSIPVINQILIDLFITPVQGRTGNAYCTDGGDMSMTYTFNVSPQLTDVEYAIVSQSNILPRPTGVTATVVQQ